MQGYNGYMQPQRTGYPGAQGMNMQPTGMGMIPQRTGYPGQQQQQQPTGFGSQPPMPTGNYSFLSAPPSSSQFSGGGLAPQMTGYPGAGAGAGGLRPQQTGFGGQGGFQALQSQPTGMPHDPRLQMMAASFMPSNTSQPFSSTGALQFASPLSQPLPQTFQTLLSNPAVVTPKVPWTLSRQEKKDYDQIFRAWTGGEGGGFIEGSMATEVFGQSGLNREDMMKIWNLSDINNRGKLNLPEFHVAMGLIYRALNGNQIPDELPAEMIPPSMRDIDSTVDFVKDLLKHDSNARSSPSIDLPGTFQSKSNTKDGTAYKHDDTRASGYKSSARHLDRKQVRYDGEDKGEELSSLRRDLENSSKVLDQSASEFAQRNEEDERLEHELDELKYRVRRVKDDIEYVSRGKRTDEKDEERRKLERELLYLMHDRLPEVEKKIEEREERKRKETRDGVRARDKRNETYGRYSARDERDRYRDDDRYRRGSRDTSRERDREYDNYSSRRPISPPPRERSPPATPAVSRSDHVAVPPPAPPAPTSVKTSAPATKSMTPEERTAFIRQQAQERLAARMRALGMAPAEEASVSAVDSSVEERLAREKKEAEEKAERAEKQQEEREAARKARLQQATEPNVPASPAPAAPAPIKSAMKKAAPAPPPPKSRATASTPVTTPKTAPPPPSSRTLAPVVPVQPKESAEDAELRAQEEKHQKAMEERRARLKRMQEEEEEAERAEEEMKKKRAAAKQAPAPQSQPREAPVASGVVSPTPTAGASTNPFHRITNAAVAAVSATAPAVKGFNPFFRPPPTSETETADKDEEAPPPPPPAPPAPAPAPAFSASKSTPAPVQTQAPPRKPAFAAEEEEWDVIDEKDDDSDSSDEETYAGSRKNREAIARSLFGGGGSARESPKPASPAPVANKAALAKLGGGDPSSRGDLLSAIKLGAGLRKTQTNDRSASSVTGKIIGDVTPPAASSSAFGSVAKSLSPAPQEPAQVTPEPEVDRKAVNRQSVDWYSGLAADDEKSGDLQHMDSVVEDDEPQSPVQRDEVKSQVEHTGDTSEFDMTTTIRVRSLFPYDGQREVDLSFKENMVLIAHPAKDSSSPWWYGMLMQEGKSGWFPNNYVEEIKPQEATALFPYTGASDEELPFAEGDTLTVVDTADADWWKVEKDGMIFIVPAAYLELR